MQEKKNVGSWIQNGSYLKIKPKSVNYLGYNTGKSICDLGIGKDFFD